MSTAEIITVIVTFIIAGVCAVTSIRHFMEKGYLFNNAYIWASKAEQESMNKKPHYRQSAIVFCLLGVVFLLIGISIILHNDKIQLLEVPLISGTLIYAIVSSVRIERQMKKF